MVWDEARRSEAREYVLRWYREALARVEGRRAVADWLRRHPPAAGPWHVVAIGKAAASMAKGAEDVLAERLAAGLLVTKPGYVPEALALPERWLVRFAEHPVPGPGSVAAGAELLRFIQRSPGEARFVFLISGGASSLVEVLPEGLELEQWQRINAWLLGSGLGIADINRIRQRLSLIKGGRLRAWLGGRQAMVLAISDVAGDDVRAIGSGLLAEPLPGELPPLPGWLARWMEAVSLPSAGTGPIPHHIVARLADALDAAAKAASAGGFRVYAKNEGLFGDAERTGRHLGRFLRDADAGVWLWGGETTVRLPPRPGRGGRNQHLALAAATALAAAERIVLLAAATDGSDGPTNDAGGLVDGGTVVQGRAAGMDAEAALAAADSGRFLAASGDLVTTGPTGTNVMDLVIALKQ